MLHSTIKMTDITKLYQTQISLSEWFARIGHAKTEALRTEDNEKRERLRVLHELIGLKYDRPHQFSCVDMANQTDTFRAFLKQHGHELCALRLIPLKKELPKLRMPGKKIADVMQWFYEQKINPAEYRADFVPHGEKPTWATIFVVNKKGILGEVVRGGHHQLTQGFYENKPMTFAFDFERWSIEPEDEEALRQVKDICACILVNPDGQKHIIERMNGSFYHNYLAGYFETAASEEFGTWFIDYSPLLGKLFENMNLSIQKKSAGLQGMGCGAGKAVGKVRIVNGMTNIENGEVLVCTMTTPELVPLMQKASAIVTDLGGILSHAAIISRELGKVCVVGTGKATQLLKDGDLVEVDADEGVVRKIK